MIYWTTEDDTKLRRLLRAGETVKEIAERLGRSYKSVENRTRRLREAGVLDPIDPHRRSPKDRAHIQVRTPANTVVGAKLRSRKEIPILREEDERIDSVFEKASDHSDFASITALAKKYAKKGGLSLEILCDELDLTPREGRELTERAIAAGYHVDMAHGKLEFRPPATLPPQEVVVDSTQFEPGEEIVVGVVSDPHFGSKHHERASLQRHVDWLYKSGVRHIFGPGDWVSGDYSFLKFEITCTGIEDQSNLVTEFIKNCPTDLNWHAIAGNHDESFRVGIDAAKMIEQQLRSQGYNNFTYYGARAALIKLYGTRFGMHHPGGGLSYAISYKIQKYVDEQPPHRRAQFLFTGHTHQQLYIRRGGCHSFLCGTFENGDSSFGRMLGGDVSVGSWLIRYRLDKQGNVASVAPEFRSQPARSMAFVTVPVQLSAP